MWGKKAMALSRGPKKWFEKENRSFVLEWTIKVNKNASEKKLRIIRKRGIRSR